MAIAVGTNSTTSPRQAVYLPAQLVATYDPSDVVESLATLETPFVANASIASNPVNQFIPAPVANPTLLVTAYNQDDMVESASVTRYPMGTSAPSAPGYSSGSVTYTGSTTTVQIRTREIWITG